MVQYRLIKQLGGERKNVFCVGDEDQSIYRFRGADSRNVRRFREDFPGAEVILLEQNYRSTQVILDAARALIDRNPDRTPKKLFTDRKGGPLITVNESDSADDEAEFIVRTIRQAYMEGAYMLRDFAVMYRTNAQSRSLEEAFIRWGLPYKLVGATRFYARREIKDLMAYLRFIHNPDDEVSLLRIINTPSRGIGAKTIAGLQSWAESRGESAGAALEALRAGEQAPMSARARRVLVTFAEMVAGWREKIAAGKPVAEVIDAVLEESGYMSWLLGGTQDDIDRVENLKELRALSEEYAELPLTRFLEDVALVSDVDNLEEDTDAVLLLTLHAAKGLEFPVVFIAGVEEGILPHERSMESLEELAEERRLIYVGITRAKDKVYLCYAFYRALYGYGQEREVSRFLSDIPPELTDGVDIGRLFRNRRRGYDRMTTWEREEEEANPVVLSSGKGKKKKSASESASSDSFKSGARVYHAKFGEGTVVESEFKGPMQQVTVVFPGAGIKKIVADYLKPVDGK